MSGDSLFVARWGDGPDVVFLHGLMASSRYWEPLAAATSGYRATAPDLFGFGRSPSPPEASYDVDCHLGALMPQLPRRAVVVAHSTGAILAAALAARHPDRVASMLLVGLPAYPDEEAARRSIGAMGLLARLTVDGSPAAWWVCEAICRFRPLAIALAPWLVRDLPPSIASDGARHTWASYSGTVLRVVVGHRAVDDLRRTPTPVTLLHGRNDRPAPLRFVEALAEGAGSGIPRSTYGSSTATITLPSAGPVSSATPSPRCWTGRAAREPRSLHRRGRLLVVAGGCTGMVMKGPRPATTIPMPSSPEPVPGPRRGEPAGGGAADLLRPVHRPLHGLATGAAGADRAATAKLLEAKRLSNAIWPMTQSRSGETWTASPRRPAGPSQHQRPAPQPCQEAP